MPSIHLIKKSDPALPAVDPVPGETGVFSSGYWTLSEEKARLLVGGQIYFHERQSERSYFGGQILEAFPVADGEKQGKIIFKFKSTKDCRGVLTSRDGW